MMTEQAPKNPETVATMAPSRVEEVPCTSRTRVAGQSRLSALAVLRHLGRLWRHSPANHYMSVRFIKFAFVGASGTVINLCAFLIFARLLGLRDWRISALATLFANLTNYIFNNAWTFEDRGHRGWFLLRGYVTYLGLSLVGMSASTLTFAGLTRADRAYLRTVHSAADSYLFALGFQLIGILVGTVFNYELNKRFTWRDRNSSESKIPGPASLSRDSSVPRGEDTGQAGSA